MPRARLPARLWLRPAAEDREAVWIILDRGRHYSTGCGEADHTAAEARLAAHIGAKHDPAAVKKRRADQTPLSDVLAVYSLDIVPKQRAPKRAVACVDRLLDWWGTMLLSEVNPTTCAAYVTHRNNASRMIRTRPRTDGAPTEKIVEPKTPRSGGGGRRDLETLRAAINYHAKRELHVGYVEVGLPEKGKPRAKYLTRTEVARLLWVCWRHTRSQRPPRGPRQGQDVVGDSFHDLRHLARFILLGIYTGSRSTPLLRASPYAASGRAYIDLEAMLYHRLPEDAIEAGNKRSPTSRLGNRIAAHVRRWRDTKLDLNSTHDKRIIDQFVVEWQGRPVTSIKTAWATAVRLAGIVGRPTPHTLRHTCVTWLKQQGMSSFDVAGFVGMSEQMVEDVYGKHDPNHQHGVANAFRAGPSKKHVPLPLSLPSKEMRSRATR